MKLLFILEFIFLINNIKGNPNPSLILIPRGQQSGEDYSQMSINSVRPKTFFISGMNSMNNQMSKEETHPVIQAVMNAVQTQIKNDLTNGLVKENTNNNSDPIPEVVITDPDQQISQQQSQQQLAPDMFQKVYKFPATTRMISSEDLMDGMNKGNSVWRSPIPILHPSGCQHHRHNKKIKAFRKRGHKQHKMIVAVEPEQTTTTTISTTTSTTTMRPEPDINENPFLSLLMSLASQSAQQPEPEQHLDNEIKAPAGLVMSISHHTEPEPVFNFPFASKPEDDFSPRIPLLMSLLGKTPEPEPEPELLFPPFNPFLSLFSKISKPMVDNEKELKENSEERNPKRFVNFNFNVNLTINNNNYPQPESKPLSEAPSPFLPFLPNLSLRMLRQLN